MWEYLKWVIALNFFELLAAVVGFIHWEKIKNSYWKGFPFYLAVIFLTEITAEYIGYQLGMREIMRGIYFFFAIPLQFLFFFWFFSKWHAAPGEKKWSYAGALIYILSWVIEFFFLQERKLVFLSLSYTIGNIILLILILRFFVRFINSDRILKYRSEFMFWVSLGLLIFYLMTLPFFGLWNSMGEKHPAFFNKYWIFQMILNCLMYLLFSVSFIMGRWK